MEWIKATKGLPKKDGEIMSRDIITLEKIGDEFKLNEGFITANGDKRTDYENIEWLSLKVWKSKKPTQTEVMIHQMTHNTGSGMHPQYEANYVRRILPVNSDEEETRRSYLWDNVFNNYFLFKIKHKDSVLTFEDWLKLNYHPPQPIS